MATEEELKALKVPQLKEKLKDAGLAVSGKKDDLIARLLENEQNAPASIGEEEQEVPAAGEEVTSEQPSSASNGTAKAGAHAREEDEDNMQVEQDAPVAKKPRVASPSPPSTSAPSSTSVLAVVAEAAAQVASEVAGEVVSSVVGSVAGELAAELVSQVVGEAVGEAVEEAIQQIEEEEEPPEYNFPPEDVGDSRPTDMYLDTINRSALDFDFERLCSVTLTHNNIYACLCDGKYFQGRGKSSPAYAHALGEDHHVFINLTTLKVYVLPDGYEVTDPSLDDIKYLLYPTFNPPLLNKLDSTLSASYDLSLRPYHPGFVGLNNLKSSSHLNCVLQSLLHVPPLRDYFILDPLCSSPATTELVRRFSMLMRKVWNPKAFKGQVSPHELLQECGNRSEGRFKITEVGDPTEFLGWLLNTLHADLGGTKKPKSSIIYSAFQGEVRMDDQKVLTTGEWGGKPQFDLAREVKSTKSPFLFLTLDLPPPPLFQDAVATNIVPQVSISTLLAKYDGLTTVEAKGILRRYKITRLPEFLILHVKRFTKNNFVEEKNSTIVNYPLRGVDMGPYVDPTTAFSQYYDLLSSVSNSTVAATARSETAWKTHVHQRAPRDAKGELAPGIGEDDEKWFQIQDLIVEEIQKEMIPLAESYIQIWERRTPDQKHQLAVDPPKPKKQTFPVVKS